MLSTEQKTIKVSALNQIVFEMFLFAWIYQIYLAHSTNISSPTTESQ